MLQMSCNASFDYRVYCLFLCIAEGCSVGMLLILVLYCIHLLAALWYLYYTTVKNICFTVHIHEEAIYLFLKAMVIVQCAQVICLSGMKFSIISTSLVYSVTFRE